MNRYARFVAALLGASLALARPVPAKAATPRCSGRASGAQAHVTLPVPSTMTFAHTGGLPRSAAR